MDLTLRRARTDDVRWIRDLLDHYSLGGVLLDKPTVTLYEDIQEFWVAERADPEAGDPLVLGCGALHVMWEDLAEVRTIAVDSRFRGAGVGHQLLDVLLRTACTIGIHKVFVLTFEVEFFARHGFRVIHGTPISPAVYRELLRSYDEGVAEFLDLERVKPNTLGNTRMLRYL